MGFPNHLFLIAEIAQTHDGSLGTALAYIDALAETGVDAVKFQTHYASEESTIREPWRIQFSKQDKTRYDYWQRMEFSEESWKIIAQRCKEKNVSFLSSPFSLKAVDVLQKCEIPAWKIGSGEINNYDLLDAVIETRKPIILSTGMSSWDEIDELYSYLKSKNAEFSLLQCTTEYPVKAEKVGLNLIPEFMQKYDCPIGFSSHIPNLSPLYAAIALGAQIIEFHACFTRQCFGPDVSSSLEISEIKDFVKGARLLESILKHKTDKDKVATELINMGSIFRKSIVAKNNLKAGTILSKEHLAFKKPGDGLAVKNIDLLLGRKLKTDKSFDSVILLDDIEEV